MASPQTPEPWIDGELRPWGPAEATRRLRVHRVIDLVVARLGLPVDQIAESLLAMPGHRYLLLEQLGHTRHSTVYGAIDQLLAREVALKLHHDERDDDGEWRALGEARTMSLLEHPNVLRVLDFGDHEGTLYSVTELCDANMKAWSVGKPWTEVVDQILEAGRGLTAVHAAGYIHGDVKPANILIKDGAAKIGDFGMSARPGLSTRIVGTPGFIAPEVADGTRTEAGDVFALAVSTWVCLFGRLPFDLPPKSADATAAIMFLAERAREGAIREPVASSKVPARLLAVLCRGLAGEPAKRPSLERWLTELAGCRPSARRGLRGGSRGVMAATLLACMFAMLGAGGHALYTIHVARPVLMPEPESEFGFTPDPDVAIDTVSQAASLARNDDPFAVWAVYWTARENQSFDAGQLIAVATILLLDAESGKASNRGASAEIAKRLGNDARWLAWDAGDQAQVNMAREIVMRSQAILSRSM